MLLQVCSSWSMAAVSWRWDGASWEARAALTFPQAWQWCRLRVRVKSQPQFMHIITWDTGTKVGGLSPKGIPSLSLSLKSNKNKWSAVQSTLSQPRSITYNSPLISVYPHLLRSPNFLIPNARCETAASALKHWPVSTRCCQSWSHNR